MENKFHGLPPLKRFKLMRQQQEEERLEDTVLVSSHLPAKKRKECRDSPLTTTFCLPAKKRVFAFHPNFIPEKPISPFDLNIEYNPQSNDEESDSQEVNDVPIATDSNNSIQITEDCPEKAQDEEEEEDEDEDGIECAVCQSTDGDPSNPIVFCDGCDLMVHTTCYGSPLTKGVPEGDWFCTQCLSSSKSPQTGDKKSFSCCLCPVAGGALKPTIHGRWAHLVCALFVPEVFFTDPDGRDGIDCSKVPKRRWEQSCYVCKCAKGCAIDCSERKCEMAFHVTCGLKEELCIEYREGGRNKGGGGVVAGFCKDHSELWKKEQQTGKFKIVARDEHKK
ncbi:hypothetical protein CsSME_00018963 [Camellia sinensis var. sinensis]